MARKIFIVYHEHRPLIKNDLPTHHRYGETPQALKDMEFDT